MSFAEYKAVFAKKKSNDPLNKMMPMEYGSGRGSGGGFSRSGGGGGDWGTCLISTIFYLKPFHDFGVLFYYFKTTYAFPLFGCLTFRIAMV